MFRLLGPVSVVVDGVETDLFTETAMARSLLIALLLANGRFLSLDRLTSTLWSRPPVSSHANIRKYANLWRQRLRSIHNGLDQRIESRRGDGYRLIADGNAVDAAAFERHADRGRAYLKDTRFPEADAELTAGLLLWRGDADANLPPDSPLAREVQLLNDRRLSAAGDLIETRMALGDAGAMVTHLRQLSIRHPWHERTWDQLIRALYRSGDPNGALDAYTNARATLRDNLGVDPSKRLDALHTAVLNHDQDLLLTAQA